MRLSRLVAIMFGGLVFCVVSGSVGPVQSQAGGTRADPRDVMFARLRETQKKLGPRAILSGGARSLFHLANNWDRVKAAAARHSVWAGVVALMLVLPIWTAWGPKASMRLLPPLAQRTAMGAIAPVGTLSIAKDTENIRLQAMPSVNE